MMFLSLKDSVCCLPISRLRVFLKGGVTISLKMVFQSLGKDALNLTKKGNIMFNPFTYVKDKFKEVVIENLTKRGLAYVKDAVVVIRGYRTLYATVLLALQALSEKVSNPDAGNVIDIVMAALKETGEGFANADLTTIADGNEITMALNAIYLLYTIFMKFYKLVNKQPQVPTIAVEKKEIKKALVLGGIEAVGQKVLEKTPIKQLK